ncbi:hypothetical protein MPTK2_1g14230 [Marchantia polymorpha subsp. ruderalis]
MARKEEPCRITLSINPKLRRLPLIPPRIRRDAALSEFHLPDETQPYFGPRSRLQTRIETETETSIMNVSRVVFCLVTMTTET